MSTPSHPNGYRPDPHRDLLLERAVDVPPELIWAAWTTPDYVKRWFAPAPFTTVDCQVDLRPGGVFRTVMRSPEGEEVPSTGCYLEVIDNRRLVWTTLLGPGFRPADAPTITGQSRPPPFTAVISLETADHGTRYTALVMHSDPDACRRHAELGFHEGWATAFDQLVALFA